MNDNSKTSNRRNPRLPKRTERHPIMKMQIPLQSKLQYLLLPKEERAELLRRMIKRIQQRQSDQIGKLGK